MSYLKWGDNAGYGQLVAPVASQTVKASIVISNHLANVDYTNHGAERDLGDKLLEELFKNKVIRLQQRKDYVNDDNANILYTAELTVVPPGTKMMNVTNEVFYIDGEHFNEHEITIALKCTYPERFI